MGYIVDGSNKWLYKSTGTTNGIKIESDGSLRKYGDSIVFEDLIGNLFGRKLYSTVGTLDYDYDEQMIKFQPSGDLTDKNDRIMFNIQLIHSMDFDDDSFFKMHLHWLQVSSTTFTLEGEYRILNNGEAAGTTWTSFSADTSSDSLFTYSSGRLNQITVFPEIDISSCNISSIVQIRFTRTDGNTGNMLISFADAHVAIDSDGSRTEWSK